MKLLQIKLSGFKSFVDSTILNLNGNLIGIVGPNGCGKSNVIDAVRWVLGESSAQRLRGGSMQDVIFNGALNRSPVSRAVVELIFDNQDKSLSGLWNTYDEISIKRVLTRNGDSTYYINNQVVRRRDITEVFLGTGVGSRGYAVIEQGMITRIIDAKPEELMAYLEEASNVSKYREKRKETLSRLEDTATNITRLQDIEQNLSSQIEELSIQAQNASLYQSLQLKLKQTQISQTLVQIKEANKSLEKIKVHFKENQVLQEELQEQIHTKEDLNVKYNDEQSKVQQTLSALNQNLNSLTHTLTTMVERDKYNSELKSRLNLEMETILQELSSLTPQSEQFDLETKNIQDNIIKLKDEIIALELTLEEKQAKFEEATTNYNVITQELKQALDEINNLERKFIVSSNTLNHKKNNIDQLKLKSKKLLEEKELKGNIENNRTHEIKEELIELEVNFENIIENLEDHKEKLITIQAQAEEIKNLINEVRAQLSSKTSRLSTIRELIIKNTSEEQGNSELDKLKGSDIALWEALEVNPGYEVAVEVALKDVLKSYIIKDLGVLSQIKDKNYLSFWVEQEIKSNEPALKLPQNSLLNFVTITNKTYDGVTELLKNYLVYENLSEALKDNIASSNIILLTRDGHIVTTNYIILNAKATQFSILEYASTQKTLEIEIEKLKDELSNYLQKLSQLDTNKNTLLNTIKELTKAHEDKLKLKHNLMLELTKCEQINLQQKNELITLTKNIETVTQEIEVTNDEYTALIVECESLENNIINLKAKSEQIKKVSQDQETRYTQAKTEVKQLEDKLNNLNHEVKLLMQKVNNIEELKQQNLMYIKQKQSKYNSLKSELESISTITNAHEISLLQAQVDELNHQIKQEDARFKEINNKLAELKLDENSLLNKKETLYNKGMDLRLKLQEYELIISNYKNTLAELGFDETDEASQEQFDTEASLKELNHIVTELNEQISKLGLVNLKAVEDLKILENKHLELSTQINDLLDSSLILKTAIEQIDKETSSTLSETYLKVSKYFDIYFKTLFGGGRAVLNLTNKDDILSSGLEVFAEPPGKKNSSIHLLSGGEKTLTAISLIFAFFNLNPAPFCLLDEVDAPLDDANTLRFCKLVQELSNNTQFVYISHNSLSMEMASQLIGVTMQEKGISTVFKVSLDEYK